MLEWEVPLRAEEEERVVFFEREAEKTCAEEVGVGFQVEVGVQVVVGSGFQVVVGEGFQVVVGSGGGFHCVVGFGSGSPPPRVQD